MLYTSFESSQNTPRIYSSTPLSRRRVSLDTTHHVVFLSFEHTHTCSDDTHTQTHMVWCCVFSIKASSVWLLNRNRFAFAILSEKESQKPTTVHLYMWELYLYIVVSLSAMQSIFYVYLYLYIEYIVHVYRFVVYKTRLHRGRCVLCVFVRETTSRESSWKIFPI